jgi:glutamyl endopeptidase
MLKHLLHTMAGIAMLGGLLISLMSPAEIMPAKGKPTPTLQAYPPPSGKSEEVIIVNDAPYPPPRTVATTQLPVANESCIFQKSQMPDDRVVAITNDCQVVDFSSFSPEYSNNDLGRFVSPFNPSSNNSPAPLRVIPPNDDRVQINDTAVWPWTTIVKIEGQFDDAHFFACSGWMLGPSTVATAGHCVYSFRDTKTFAYNVTATPALNTSAANSQPFGSCRAMTSSVLSPWFNNGDSGYDYGVYKLSCRIGYQTGNPGIQVINGSGDGKNGAVTGYPGDKGGTTMWTAGGAVTSSLPKTFFFDVDTELGQSGSPLWVNDPGCDPCVIGFFTDQYDPPTMNSGPRITNEAFNYLLAEQQFLAHNVYLPIIVK